MKKSILVIAIGLLVFESTSLSAEEPQEYPSIESYNHFAVQYSNRNLCGVHCVYALLADFSIPVEFESILEKMPPGIYGNSMDQIVSYIEKRTTFEAIPVRCKAESLEAELANDKCRAIANINDHWLLIRGAHDGEFEIVDYPRKYFLPIDVVDRNWDGYAIIIYQTRSFAGLGILSIITIFIVIVIIWMRMNSRKAKCPKSMLDNYMLELNFCNFMVKPIEP